LLDGKMTERSAPIAIWEYNTGRFTGTKAQPYIDPALQEGTTPLAKLAGGKATRDFRNVRHPGEITDVDDLGPRAITDGRFKLVIHEQKQGEAKRELFDLETDPAEKTNLFQQQPETAAKLQTTLRDWQRSVLHRLTGKDYRK
jgi:hypothetical protein